MTATTRRWLPTHYSASHRALVALGAIIAFGIFDNVMTNVLLPQWAFVPYRAFTIVVVLGLSLRLGGLGWSQLGLDRSSLPNGLRWGGVCMAVVGAGYLIAALLPATQDLFRDERVADLSTGGVFYAALIAVPLGTVAAEELIFRGALLGLGNVLWRTVTAVAVSSLLFGLWHVIPSLDFLASNAGAAELGANVANPQLLSVLGTVLGTATAGAFLCWLRIRSGSLLAPIMLHIATNSFGYVASWLVLTST